MSSQRSHSDPNNTDTEALRSLAWEIEILTEVERSEHNAARVDVTGDRERRG